MKPKALVALVVSFLLVFLFPQFNNVLAYEALFSEHCADCHSDDTPTCNGCHAHGVWEDSSRTVSNLTATTDLDRYQPGQAMTVVFSGGYRTGWIRAILYDEQWQELDRITGPMETGDGGSGLPEYQFPVVLRASAPSEPGVYQWNTTWFGAAFDKDNVSLLHTEVVVPINQFQVAPVCDDLDEDGFEDASCNPEPDFGGGDCDDTDPLVHPGADEVCDDGIDNDCDGQVDMDDWDCVGPPPLDEDEDGFTSDVDCDDHNPLVHPGADEICEDGIDNDCDGKIDEGCNDFAPPAIVEDSVLPFPGQGIDDDQVVPNRTAIRMRFVDNAGLAMADETFRTLITANAVYQEDGDEILEPIPGETRFKEVVAGDPTDVWAVFIPDFEDTFGDGLPPGRMIQVDVEASDVFGNSRTFFDDGSFRFTTVDGDGIVLPAQFVDDPDPFEDGDTIIVTLLDGPMAGSFMVFPDTLEPAPFFGPPEEIPGLPNGLDGFGEPLNLEPPTVFTDDCLTLVIPLSEGTDPGQFDVWHFDPVTGWEEAFEGDGWLVSRTNHNAFPDEGDPPAVELCINHFTGVQLAVGEVDDDGGSDDDCFIATAAFGSSMAADVLVLRDFRDAYLLPNRLGKSFVKFYYRTSPAIARVIARHEMLRAMTRTGLAPIVWTCRLSLESPSVTLALGVAGSAAVLATFFVLGGRGRRRRREANN
jgi:hypothetical protein